MAGVLRRQPKVDFRTALGAGLRGLDDKSVLTLAAKEGRIPVTHDRRTMPRHFAEFIRTATSPGLILVAQKANEAARRAGLPLVGHAPVNLSLDAMLDARQQSLAHVGELTRLYFNPVMRHRWSLVAGGIGLLIALVVSLTSGLLAVIRRNRRVPRPHTRVQRSTAVLAASGGVAAACYGGFSPGGPLFDSNGLRVIFTAAALGLPLITPGSSLHRELALLHEARLTRYEALHAATVAPASFLGKTEEFGTIQVGRRADLLLVEGNPLQDLSSLRQPLAVMVRGRWLPREQLDAMLAALR